MKNTYELKRLYRQGETVSVSALIKAGILAETEATRMLTVQMNDLYTTDKNASAKLRNTIRAAGYVIASTGNMNRDRVFEERI
jgi:hypothetical protein